ncbi:MAG: hypothetical protein QXT00_02650 [Ignisphaera sp.]
MPNGAQEQTRLPTVLENLARMLQQYNMSEAEARATALELAWVTPQGAPLVKPDYETLMGIVERVVFASGIGAYKDRQANIEFIRKALSKNPTKGIPTAAIYYDAKAGRERIIWSERFFRNIAYDAPAISVYAIAFSVTFGALLHDYWQKTHPQEPIPAHLTYFKRLMNDTNLLISTVNNIIAGDNTSNDITYFMSHMLNLLRDIESPNSWIDENSREALRRIELAISVPIKEDLNSVTVIDEMLGVLQNTLNWINAQQVRAQLYYTLSTVTQAIKQNQLYATRKAHEMSNTLGAVILHEYLHKVGRHIYEEMARDYRKRLIEHAAIRIKELIEQQKKDWVLKLPDDQTVRVTDAHTVQSVIDTIEGLARQIPKINSAIHEALNCAFDCDINSFVLCWFLSSGRVARSGLGALFFVYNMVFPARVGEEVSTNIARYIAAYGRLLGERLYNTTEVKAPPPPPPQPPGPPKGGEDEGEDEDTDGGGGIDGYIEDEWWERPKRGRQKQDIDDMFSNNRDKYTNPDITKAPDEEKEEPAEEKEEEAEGKDKEEEEKRTEEEKAKAPDDTEQQKRQEEQREDVDDAARRVMRDVVKRAAGSGASFGTDWTNFFREQGIQVPQRERTPLPPITQDWHNVLRRLMESWVGITEAVISGRETGQPPGRYEERTIMGIGRRAEDTTIYRRTEEGVKHVILALLTDTSPSMGSIYENVTAEVLNILKTLAPGGVLTGSDWVVGQDVVRTTVITGGLDTVLRLDAMSFGINPTQQWLETAASIMRNTGEGGGTDILGSEALVAFFNLLAAQRPVPEAIYSKEYLQSVYSAVGRDIVQQKIKDVYNSLQKVTAHAERVLLAVVVATDGYTPGISYKHDATVQQMWSALNRLVESGRGLASVLDSIALVFVLYPVSTGESAVREFNEMSDNLFSALPGGMDITITGGALNTRARQYNIGKCTVTIVTMLGRRLHEINAGDRQSLQDVMSAPTDAARQHLATIGAQVEEAEATTTTTPAPTPQPTPAPPEEEKPEEEPEEEAVEEVTPARQPEPTPAPEETEEGVGAQPEQPTEPEESKEGESKEREELLKAFIDAFLRGLGGR